VTIRILTAAMCAAMLSSGLVTAAQQQAQDPGDTRQVTVTGCLSVNAAARTYILTAKPANVAQTGGAVANPPTTIEYQLVGGNGLQQHVGETLEVTGKVNPEHAATAKSESKQSGAPANGQHTDKKPKVETKTETKIRAQVMHVDSFRTIDAACKPTK
jgi:hypothetical protein